ncbi:MAG: radical SAM/SPASM domain-containing protein [Desulfovibrio sp.]
MDHIKRRLIDDPRYRRRREACLERPTVFIALTGHCNLACAYCSTRNVRRERRNMDTALARHIVDQCLANDWPFSFGQTYEPFLHPEVEAVIAHVAAGGQVFSCATNGLAIRKSAYDLPMRLLLSYSATPEDFALRGARLSFAAYREKILGFLRHRIRHRVPGTIAVQIADYGIFRDGLDYSKAIGDVDGILAKTRDLAAQLGLRDTATPAASRLDIAARKPLVLFADGDTVIQVQPTKIMPNSYDAFVPLEAAAARRGYCDSCHTMLSLQADGTAAFCCCDPTARATAGRITPETDLRDFWLGQDMARIRAAFDAFAPEHPFCTQCLANVSEHIKPLLTVADPGLVAVILRDQGVTDDLPWFSFP